MSSRQLAKKMRVEKNFLCNVRRKMLVGDLAAPKLREKNNKLRITESELDYFTLYAKDNIYYLDEYQKKLAPLYALNAFSDISIVSKALHNILNLLKKKTT